jgi:hypothetical protein
MAGVTVALEELESDVAAKAAVAANRRTNTRNIFLVILSVLPLRPRSKGLIKKILVPGTGQQQQNRASAMARFPF